MTDAKTDAKTDDGQEHSQASELLDRAGAIAVPSSDNQDGAVADELPRATAQLGTARYVHAAFIAAAIFVGYISSQLLTLIWNRLAEAPWALRLVPQLVKFDEDVRGDVGLIFGAIVGALTVVRIYRRPAIRVWADDVAGELAKVSWPDREGVTNNTLIVIVASLVATVYVTVLDRFWGFSTGLIYAP